MKKRSHVIDLEEGEKIVYEVRKHLFVFYSKISGLILAALIPLFFAAPLAEFLGGKFAEGQGMEIFIAIYLLYVFLLWAIAFFQWTDYYLDVWIVTNKRVFDVDQRGMFNRHISVFRLENIQDVSVVVEGVLATFLKWGRVHIHTAGQRKDFIIDHADRPLEVKRRIIQIHDEIMKKYGPGVGPRRSIAKDDSDERGPDGKKGGKKK